MMRSAACILVLTAAAIFASAMSAKPSAESARQKSVSSADETANKCSPNVLAVFLTGNELGVLQPCGCSGEQLGGLDRRSAIFNSVPASSRLIVETGSFVKDTSEQELMKFNILVRSYSLLNYDLVNLRRQDFEIARNLGLLDEPVVRFISPHTLDDAGSPTVSRNVSAKYSRKFLLEDKAVTVTIATFDADSTPVEQLRDIFVPQADQQTVNILILSRCDVDIVDSVSKTGIVDCLVCPAESDEAMLVSGPNEKPLLVSVGQYGKYVGRLQITLGDAQNKPNLTFVPVPVGEDLPREESLLELYTFYQQLVKEADLLTRYPRFPLPNGLKYAGSQSCKTCHAYEYDKWSTKAHAHAYATLQEVGSQYDPECVICHVVGMEYESGFVSEHESSEDLKNVGCENCHGPGSEHIRTLGKSKTTEPTSDCTNCHTPERSADYAGRRQEYFEKIIHWREPNNADNVKKLEGSKK